MTEARDFQCHAHVTDDLGNRSLPSDHVAIHIVVTKNRATAPEPAIRS